MPVVFTFSLSSFDSTLLSSFLFFCQCLIRKASPKARSAATPHRRHSLRSVAQCSAAQCSAVLHSVSGWFAWLRCVAIADAQTADSGQLTQETCTTTLCSHCCSFFVVTPLFFHQVRAKGRPVTKEVATELKKAFSKNIIKVRLPLHCAAEDGAVLCCAVLFRLPRSSNQLSPSEHGFFIFVLFLGI